MDLKRVHWLSIALYLVVAIAIGSEIWPKFELSADWVSAVATVVSALLSIASVVAVFFVWKQLEQNRHQLELNRLELEQTKDIAQLQFEDGLAKEYRELASRIPTKALLGSGLTPKEYAAAFDELFRYVDLSNEQVLLRQAGRIGNDTWTNWCSGIEYNLSLPAFSKAWCEVKNKSAKQFSELRRLEATAFLGDPKSWNVKDGS
ncbi:MAG: hypothetical protein RJB68_1970 [Pseudomonadota bacterium]|jgi:hypothetical protein